MKLPRPYIPLSTRIKVARRQVLQFPDDHRGIKGFLSTPLVNLLTANIGSVGSKRAQLNWYLRVLFGKEKFHLDHDPPLMLREKVYYSNGEFCGYNPPANDPNFLTYIKAESHRVKTFIKGEGARRSDMGQRRYLKRVHAKRNPKPRFKPRAAKHIRRIPHASVTGNHDSKAK